MTEQPPQPQSERSRTIPDGGLAASGLPDWMQAQPEWSIRPAASNPQVVTARTIPAPDHSSIDLAAILTAEDLPVWLQEIARRSTGDQDGLDATSDTPGLETGSVSLETPADPLEVADVVPQPWWASDRIMAGLLIAVALTILFVLITTISVT